MTDLAELLKSAGLGNDARVLRIGRAVPMVEQQLTTVLDAFDGPVIAADGDPFNDALPADVDLCVVSTAVARGPDVFEELLYDRLAQILKPGAVAVFEFCRDASDEALTRMKVAPVSRDALRTFNETNFGAAKIDSITPIESRLKNDPFECLGWAVRNKWSAGDEPIVWLVLRKRPTKDVAPAIKRSLRSNRYPLSELTAFLRALSDGGIKFLTTADFAERARAHYATSTRMPPNPPFGLVKLDIHREIHRPLEIARALKSVSVPGLFLMMHRHPFNETFYDADETWDILRAIRDQGHEIGLHADIIHLIRTYGDLHAGLAAALDDFRRRGFEIRSATLHGDTSKHITERGLKARDFFAEDRDRTTWDGNPPQGEEALADHVGRYSYTGLAEKSGIEYLAEGAFRAHGKLLSPDLFVYLTDNNKSLQVMNIPNGDGTTRMLGGNPQFRVPPEFAPKALDVLRAHPFLALFHPQWFW